MPKNIVKKKERKKIPALDNIFQFIWKSDIQNPHYKYF